MISRRTPGRKVAHVLSLSFAALAVAVAAELGHRHTAAQYLGFVCDLARESAPEHPVVGVDGEGVPDEREVDGVDGWAGSRPVRVGNAAAAQIQHDAYGLIVEAVAAYVRTGGRLRPDMWQLVRDLRVWPDPAAPLDQEAGLYLALLVGLYSLPLWIHDLWGELNAPDLSRAIDRQERHVHWPRVTAQAA